MSICMALLLFVLHRMLLLLLLLLLLVLAAVVLMLLVLALLLLLGPVRANQSAFVHKIAGLLPNSSPIHQSCY
jgi:hypothetical protein